LDGVICEKPGVDKPTKIITHSKLKTEAEQKRDGLDVTLSFRGIFDLLFQNGLSSTNRLEAVL
jgi:hypothetical protein